MSGGRSLRDRAKRLLDLYRARGMRVAAAESCTGGLLATALTEIAGSSDVFECSFVTYSNEAKQQVLGVPAATLRRYGAVSAETAAAMAKGALKRSSADCAVSITGIAGPSGGSEAKPVGTVFIGLAGDFPTLVVKNHNPYDRETFKWVTAQQALELLRRKLGRQH